MTSTKKMSHTYGLRKKNIRRKKKIVTGYVKKYDPSRFFFATGNVGYIETYFYVINPNPNPNHGKIQKNTLKSQLPPKDVN